MINTNTATTIDIHFLAEPDPPRLHMPILGDLVIMLMFSLIVTVIRKRFLSVTPADDDDRAYCMTCGKMQPMVHQCNKSLAESLKETRKNPKSPLRSISLSHSYHK